jgi:catalase-peroxidase
MVFLSESMALGQLLVLAISVLPLTSAVSCPYVRGNQARDAGIPLPHPESILEPRYNQDEDFGRCSRKSKVAGGGARSEDWWPCELNLAVLRQNTDESNPLGGAFDYATEFAKLDGRHFHLDCQSLDPRC